MVRMSISKSDISRNQSLLNRPGPHAFPGFIAPIAAATSVKGLVGSISIP